MLSFIKKIFIFRSIALKISALLIFVISHNLAIAETPQWKQDVEYIGGNAPCHIIKLIHIDERNPTWWDIIPNTLHAVQKKAEKNLDHQHLQNVASAQKIIMFFHNHPPLTPKGWHFYKLLCNRFKKPFSPALASYWFSADLPPEKQDKMLKLFSQDIPSKVHLQRAILLLWQGHPQLASKMLKYIPGSHPALSMAIRFLTKDAHLNDKTILKDFHNLPPSQKKLAILTMARVKFFIRASQAEEAYKAFKEMASPGRSDDLSFEAAPSKDFSISIIKDITEDITKAITKASSRCLAQLTTALIREQIQEGHKYFVQGQKEQALKSYKRSFLPPKTWREEWAECLWLRGFVYAACLKEPKKALPYFLALTKFLYENKSIINALKLQGIRLDQSCHFPPKTCYRYKVRGLFWAGLCYEKLGNTEQAKKCYTQASKYPFFFYGQMARYKLKLPLTMKFASANSEKGFVSKDRKQIAAIISHWNAKKGSQNISYYAPHAVYMAKDLAHAACGPTPEKIQEEVEEYYRFTPHSSYNIKNLAARISNPEDVKKAIELMGILNPCDQTHFAKTFSWDPETTFAEAYPMTKLPIVPHNKALIYGITLAESSFNPSIISDAGARGIMQIMPHEAPRLAKEAGLIFNFDKMLNADYSFQLGITEIQGKIKEHPHYALAIAAYNAGLKKLIQWKESIPFKATPEDCWIWIESIPYGETRAYVPRVLENLFIYKWRLNEPATWQDVDKIFRKK
jgi:tetratricopeptide (TPR) repeat protein